MSGDRLVVGAPGEETRGVYAGAAYVFERTDDVWMETAKILADDTDAGDSFGSSVAIDGDNVIVGAPYKDVNGSEEGAAYVFLRDGSGGWNEVARLTRSDGGASPAPAFGAAVSISADFAIVGAHWDSDVGADGGAAYIFERDGGGSWTQAAKLTSSDGEAGDYFGVSVALRDGRAIVGAAREDSGAQNAGAAYVFERIESGSWLETAKLQASERALDNGFGNSVGIDGDRVVVGSSRCCPVGFEAGAAYVFRREGTGNWLEEAVLRATDRQVEDHFGSSVAISGRMVIGGALNEDEGGSDAGSSYLFQGSSGTWVQLAKMLAADAEANDNFGAVVSLSSNHAVVGSWGEDSGGTNAGAAYVFEIASTGTNVADAELPSDVQLYPVFPNPVHADAAIWFRLSRPTYARIAIVDIIGRQTRMLGDGTWPAGLQKIDIKAHDLPGGVYVLRLDGDSFQEVTTLVKVP